MDYRQFLGRKTEAVLPYLGGPTVDAPDRRLRVAAGLEPGWWRFTLEGRQATPLRKADAPEFGSTPKVPGHLLGSHLVRDGAVAETVYLLPVEEAPPFSPCVARRWHSGDLLFEELPFEGEAEASVRLAWEEGRSLADVKGISASLRAAFGYAIAERAARELQIPASPAEVRPRLREIAEGGRAAAEQVLRALAAERLAYQRQAAAERREQERRAVAGQVEAERVRRLEAARAVHANAEDRVDTALAAAGAHLAGVRRLADDLLEVVYRFMGERFITLVEPATLQIVDAGVCLGHPDRGRVLTLESLPAVIREAIDTGRLVITRHG